MNLSPLYLLRQNLSADPELMNIPRAARQLTEGVTSFCLLNTGITREPLRPPDIYLGSGVQIPVLMHVWQAFISMPLLPVVFCHRVPEDSGSTAAVLVTRPLIHGVATTHSCNCILLSLHCCLKHAGTGSLHDSSVDTSISLSSSRDLLCPVVPRPRCFECSEHRGADTEWKSILISPGSDVQRGFCQGEGGT